MNPIVLEMRNITKEFPGVRALEDVNFQVSEGEIHALVGENGAGKSTLMKILSGVYPCGSFKGTIHLFGAEQKFHHIRDAQKSGVSIVHQELNLVQELTAGENIFLGREPMRAGRTFVDWAGLHENARAILETLGVAIHSKKNVRDLSVGEQQVIEIAKTLSQKAKVIILDEPTSALSEKESAKLFEILLSLKEKGVTMIYISHKLDEVFSIADTITVLRDGSSVKTVPRAKVTQKEVIALMVGRELQQLYPGALHQRGEEVLRVEKFCVKHPFLPGEKIVRDVSFAVHRGEILGIAGLMGSGRSELVTGIFGAFPKNVSGTVFIDGKQVRIRSPREAIELGLGLATEDRKLFGLILGMSVGSNLSLPSLDLVCMGPFLMKEEENKMIRKYMEELQIKAPGIDVAVEKLSGGNQQKIVLSKWLARSPKVLFLDEPTRGIDVGAKSEIYHLMNRLVEKGIGIVMISSDLQEVLGMSDRVLVMREGVVTKELDGKRTSAEEVMRYAVMSEAAHA